MGLSGHKNESSIKQYAVECPESKKEDYVQTLNTRLGPNPKASTTAETVTTTSDKENSDNPNDMNINDLPNFDLITLMFENIDDDLLLKALNETEIQVLQNQDIIPKQTAPLKD